MFNRIRHLSRSIKEKSLKRISVSIILIFIFSGAVLLADGYLDSSLFNSTSGALYLGPSYFDVYRSLRINSGSSSTGLKIGASGTDNLAYLQLIGEATWQLTSHSSIGNFYIKNNDINHFTIETSGEVGIGTTSPKAKLDVNGQIIGGFGSQSTDSVQDFNDITNCRPGSGYTLILGENFDSVVTHGPPTTTYYHPFNFEFQSKDGSGNITQFAIPYGAISNMNNGMYMRGRNDDTWSNWMRIITENNDGKVGIGTTNPEQKLHIEGYVKAQGYYCDSDVRLKKNISPFKNALEKVLKLNGITFFWKRDDYKDRNFSKDKQLGLIAQDVENIIPEIVNTDKKGFKSVSYNKICVILIEAIKELKSESDSKDEKIASLHNEISSLKKEVASLQILNERITSLEEKIRNTSDHELAIRK